MQTDGGQERLTNSPTYPGVPQAVDMTSPLLSILERPKSLIMIFDSSWGLKYSKFSGWRGETGREIDRARIKYFYYIFVYRAF